MLIFVPPMVTTVTAIIMGNMKQKVETMKRAILMMILEMMIMMILKFSALEK